MQFKTLFAFSSLVILGNVVGTLADVDWHEVPNACTDVCRAVVEGSQQCDDSTDNDRAEMECMCRMQNAANVVPVCEACVAKYHHEVSDDDDGPHDNDVHDIIRFCSFTTTSFNQAAATSAANTVTTSMPSADSATASTVTSASPVTVTTTSPATETAASATVSGTTVPGTTSGAGTGSGVGASTSSSSTAAASATGNVAPAAVPKASSAVAIMGLLILPWL